MEVHIIRGFHGLLAAILLRQRMGGVEDVCRLCDEHMVTLEHLWLSCPFGRAIWFKCIGGATQQYGPQQDSNAWFVNLFNIKPPHLSFDFMDFLSYVACFGWTIWKIRNEVVFEGKVPHIETACRLFQHYLADVKAIKNSNSNSLVGQDPNRDQMVQVVWKCPSPPMLSSILMAL